MIEFTCMPSLNLSEDKIDELASIYPQGQHNRYWFSCRLTSTDERLVAIATKLSKWGMVPRTDCSRQPRPDEYQIRYEREYDSADLAICEFLELGPTGVFYEYGRYDDGLLSIEERYLPEEPSDFLAIHTWAIVTRRVRDLVSGSALKGPRFTPVLFVTNAVMRGDPGAECAPLENSPYWEIDTDLTMPPLSPTMNIVDSEGKLAERGESYSNGFHRRDGLYLHPELHYRASDLKGIEPFDLARTYEVFGNRQGRHGRFEDHPFDQPLIASNRFYRFCVDHGLNADWVPIRIDP